MSQRSFSGVSLGRARAVLVVVLLSAAASTAAPSEELEGRALVEALREGGYNIYFRHAATDWSLSDNVSAPGDWLSCDPDEMRQLAPEGREASRAIGAAMRALELPVDHVLASPYCRTVETGELLGVGDVKTTTDIINTRVARYFGGVAAIARTARRALATPPPPRSNVVLVAHGNVLRAASDVYVGEAEGAIFRPDGEGGFDLVARVTPRGWAELSAAHPAR